MCKTGAIPQEVIKLISLTLDGLDTDLSRRVARLVEAGKWDDIPKGVNPSDYPLTPEGAARFRDDFQVTELLRKRVFGGTVTAKQRKTAAFESWLESEKHNHRTNCRLAPWLDGYPSELEPAAAAQMYTFICCVKKEIRRVIGRLPKVLNGRFSSGTNYGQFQTYHTVAHKLHAPSITPALKSVLAWSRHGLQLPPVWERALGEVGITIDSLHEVRGERFSTVPKNYETDRTIGVQPVVNLYFQLGVAEIWRPRILSHASLDLEMGQAEHSELARLASISNGDATIDLRNASNSLATLVVKLFFDEWFDLLDLIRSKTVKVNGKVYQLEMFSAMGNGFTFELETVFFYAICRACGVINPKVYGDDIIVPQSHAASVISALRYFGFETNAKKTFIEGPFRESCGGNWFLGVDVTPVRFTELPTKPSDWFTMHNQLYELGSRVNRAKKHVLMQIPAELRVCGGPPCLGDVVLWGRPMTRRWRGQIGFVKCWRPLPVKWSWRRLFDNWESSHLQMAVALSGHLCSTSQSLMAREVRGSSELHHANNRPIQHFLQSRGVSGYKLGLVAWSGNATPSELARMRSIGCDTPIVKPSGGPRGWFAAVSTLS